MGFGPHIDPAEQKCSDSGVGRKPELSLLLH
jgi:hypothetical protein